MRAGRVVEVGNIFKLDTRYAEAFGAYFLDGHGRRRPILMGSYGIGVGRLLACIAEEHRDEDRLIWPVSVAPYHVHLVASDDGGWPRGFTGICYRLAPRCSTTTGGRALGRSLRTPTSSGPPSA